VLKLLVCTLAIALTLSALPRHAMATEPTVIHVAAAADDCVGEADEDKIDLERYVWCADDFKSTARAKFTKADCISDSRALIPGAVYYGSQKWCETEVPEPEEILDGLGVEALAQARLVRRLNQFGVFGDSRPMAAPDDVRITPNVQWEVHIRNLHDNFYTTGSAARVGDILTCCTFGFHPRC
jgi:hypothetical protein